LRYVFSVFLQLSPHSPTPDLQPSEISSLHWIDLDRLTPPFDKHDWGHVEIDISSRLSPRNRFVRVLLRGLVGGMKWVPESFETSSKIHIPGESKADETRIKLFRFTSLLLPDEPDCISPEYLPEFDDLQREGHGTVLGKNGQRRLRLWGLTLGMTLSVHAVLALLGWVILISLGPLLLAATQRLVITPPSAGYDPARQTSIHLGRFGKDAPTWSCLT
jgi:hypothetical protein